MLARKQIDEAISAAGETKTPCKGATFGQQLVRLDNAPIATGPRINVAVGRLFMRCITRQFHVAPRAGAGVEMARLNQLLEHLLITRQSLRLDQRNRERLAAGTMIPIDTEPPQILDQLLGRPRLTAWGFQILNPQQQRATGSTNDRPGDQKGSSITEMLGAGRGWSEPANRLGAVKQTHGGCQPLRPAYRWSIGVKSWMVGPM